MEELKNACPTATKEGAGSDGMMEAWKNGRMEVPLLSEQSKHNLTVSFRPVSVLKV